VDQPAIKCSTPRLLSACWLMPTMRKNEGHVGL